MDWPIEPGQIWQCADQRLICADMRSVGPDVIGHYDTLVFDPPWDDPLFCTNLPAKSKLVMAGSAWLQRAIEIHGAPTWLFVWDLRGRLFVKDRPLAAAKYCLWYGELDSYRQSAVLMGAAQSAQAITTQSSAHASGNAGGKWLSDIYTCTIKEARKDNPHPHCKPLDWMTALLGNCTSGTVFDPCAGGGTTLLAAQMLRRRATGVEISPEHCNLILRRMHALTGVTPIMTGTI